MSKVGSEVPEDVRVIPATFTRLELALVILYIVFGGFFIWYLLENFINYYETGESVWGLPKPVVGSLLLAIEWIIACLTVFTIYYIIIKRKLKR